MSALMLSPPGAVARVSGGARGTAPAVALRGSSFAPGLRIRDRAPAVGAPRGASVISAGLRRKKKASAEEADLAAAEADDAADETVVVKPVAAAPAMPLQATATPPVMQYTPAIATPALPPPPPPAPAKGNSVPWWMWVGAGLLLAKGFDKMMGMVKTNAQKMMMDQMMKQMGGGAAPGGANPFGMPGAGGANPFGAPPGGANPFGGMGGMPPPPFPGAGAGFPAGGSTTDTTATPVPPKPASPAPAAAAAATASTAAPAAAEPAAKESAFADVSSSVASEFAGNDAPKEEAPQEIFFGDVDAEIPVDSPSTSGAAGGMPGMGDMGGMPSMPGMEMPGMGGMPGGGGGGGGGGAGGMFTVEMLEKMMEDPSMQQMIYPYLPEGMRNPDTFKWMMSNPMYREQLQTMLGQMNSGEGMPPEMQDMMNNFSMNNDDVKAQFDAMGMTPDQVIGKIMEKPELASAFQNPKVQAAIMDCSTNPMNIMKYQSDPEIMKVFTELSGLFPGGPEMGMPPGMGGMPPQ